KVINQAGNKPVNGAVVFLSNTTISSKLVPVSGGFALKNIKPGHYDLVIAAPGFNTYTQSVNVEGSNIALQPVSLSVKPAAPVPDISSPENTQTAFNKNLVLFRAEFLGLSA